MNYLKQSKGSNRNSTSTPLRMKIILGVILVLFLLLIGQLAYLQLFYGGRFQAEVQQTDQKIVSNNVPRGVMYDSSGKILVGNKANNAITYTKNSSITSSQIYKVSNHLSQYITLDDEKPTKRQLYDYYLANSKISEKETAKLPKSERYDSNGDALSSSQIYNNVLKRVEKQNIQKNSCFNF